METIDCRGLACPAPVLRTKDTIETGNLDEIAIIVDNEAAKENVSRFLRSRNFEISVDPEGDDFRIGGKKTGEFEGIEETSEVPNAETQKIMVMVATDRIGHGDDELGTKLMTSFLTTLKEMGVDLWRLVFVNNGVKSSFV